MSGFRTKLDYSNNRQIKQHIETTTQLSGTTIFGVPYNTLPVGPDLNTTGISQSLSVVGSTFSGNNSISIFTWYDEAMQLGYPYLTAITPTNSGTTQFVPEVFTAGTTTIIDGNTVVLNYTGVSYDLTAIAMDDLGGGNYSGTVVSNTLNFLSAGTLDFTGRTIWVDVCGTTRTEKLIVTHNAQVGFVLTCVDTDGTLTYLPASGITSGVTTYWVAGTNTDAILTLNSGNISSGVLSVAEGFVTTASGDYSHAEGLGSIASGTGAHAEGRSTNAFGVTSHSEGRFSQANNDYSHAEGFDTRADGLQSHAEGNSSISSGISSHAEGEFTQALGDYSHSECAATQAIGYASHAEGDTTIAQGDRSHAEGYQSQAIGDFASHAEGYQTIASGLTSHAEGSGTEANGGISHAEGSFTKANGTASHAQGYFTEANAQYSHAEGENTRANGQSSHAEGSLTIASGSSSHAQGGNTLALGNFSHAGGLNTIASGLTSFVHGSGSTAGGIGTIVLGRGIIGTTNDTTYVDRLNIRTLSAGTSTFVLGVDANGNIGNFGVSTFTGGTVVGPTIFTGGLSANTMSANTMSSTTINIGTARLTQDLQNIANASLSTGLYMFTNSGITSTGGSLYNVGAVKGWVINSDDTLNNNPIFVNYSGGSGLTTPYINTAPASYFYINSASTLTITNTYPTVTERRDNIFLGVIGHPVSGSGITGIGNSPDIIMNEMSQVRAMFTPIKFINDGVVPYANSTNMTLANTSGKLYGLGIGFITNGNHAPSVIDIAAGTPTTFQYRTQTGTTFANTTTISAVTYDVGGVATAVPGGGATSTNQRIYLLQNGTIRIQFGQTTYASLALAISGIQTEPFVAFANTKLGILIGILSVTKNATDLSNTAQAQFFPVSKFGETIGAAAGTSTATLQSAYNNSSTPEIVTNNTLFGLTIQRGSASDTDMVFSTLNGAGATTLSINGNGGLSATTLSARTTYVGGTGATNNSPFGFVHGRNSSAGTANDIFILGPNITGGTSGYTYVNALNIKQVTTLSSQFNLGVDSNGNVARSTILLTGGSGANSIQTVTGLTQANGIVSFAIGSASTAGGQASMAQGSFCQSVGGSSHAEGRSSLANGDNSHAEGLNASAYLSSAHAEGTLTTASGTAAHAEGFNTIANSNAAHAEGTLTKALEDSSHAEGFQSSATTFASHAEGNGTKTLANNAHAEGAQTVASGSSSHAEGQRSQAGGTSSHAEGTDTFAAGAQSHAEGSGTTAQALVSHAGGYDSRALGIASFVHGTASTASNVCTVVLGRNIIGLSADTTYVDGLNIKTVGAGPSIVSIGVDANGYVVNQVSDISFKENISTLENALDKIKRLRGVKYQWKNRFAGGDAFRVGFIAQEVNEVEPLLVTNINEGLLGVHYSDVTALLVEAIKELSSGVTTTTNTFLETQTILAEDNNIELNFNGTQETAIGGGINVINAKENGESAEFKTDENGDWVTNNALKPKELIIPYYTPSATTDTNGSIGSLTRDDDYLYVKNNTGWKRTNFENF